MTANETPRSRGAFGESAGRSVLPQNTAPQRWMRPATPTEVLEGRRPMHELRADVFDLCREVWRRSQEAAQRRVDAAQHDADRFYYYLHNSEEVRAQHAANLKAIEVRLARVAEAERWAELDRIAAERSEGAR